VISLPFVFGLLIALFGQSPLSRRLLSFISAASTVIVSLVMLAPALKNQVAVTPALKVAPNLYLSLRADGLGVFFVITIAAFWLLISMYSIAFLRDEFSRRRFFTFLALSISAALGVGLAANLFTLLFFYELLTVSSYFLIMNRETKESLAAGRKYLLYSFSSEMVILFAIFLTFANTGSLSLTHLGLFSKPVDSRLLATIFFMYIIGFGIKSTLFPFQGWLVDAMDASTPVCALISLVVVQAGILGILRVIFNVFGYQLVEKSGWGLSLAWWAVITIIIGAILAIKAKDLKVLLAYSTMSQVSYILMAAPLLTKTALEGALVQIPHHGFIKLAMFFGVGIIVKNAKIRDKGKITGIFRRFPISMAAFSLASIMMIGVPPFAGFVTKWFIGTGAFEAGEPLFVLKVITGALLTGGYVLPLIYWIYFRESPQPLSFNEAHWLLVVPLILTVVLAAEFGILAGSWFSPLTLSKVAARQLLGVR
jgi:multicomponent Na+:H+ antiporter subunit D